MKFGRILAVLALFASFFSFAHACALCALYTPTAHADIKFNLQGETIKTAAVTWTFSENFTALTLQSYDENADKALSKNEAWKVQKSLLDYIVPRGYLTSVGYYDGASETVNLHTKTLSQRVYLEGGRLNFEYILELNLAVKDGRVVTVEIFDREGFFNFKISSPEPYALTDKIYLVPNVNLHAAFFEMTSKAPKIEPAKPELSSLIKPQNKQNLEQIDAEDKAKFDSVSGMSLQFLERLKELIKINSAELNALNFALLAAVSFFYGFLHAAGPGHAKMLTASYFVANGGSYSRALAFAMKVGFAHVAGAFLLVLFSYVFLNAFLTNKVSDMAGAMTKISAVTIVCVSLYMIYAKLKKTALKPKFSFAAAPVSGEKGANLASKVFGSNLASASNLSANQFSPAAHESQCGCAACRASNEAPKTASEWLVVLAGSLVPCPGTLLVFVLAFSLNSYAAGLASGLFMGLGMGAVIFLAAVCGFKLKGAVRFRALRTCCEFAALFVMLGLGVFMFYISGKVSVL
ncbi:MAG: DUF1007 family protein [Campylobacter sp.]|uniref:HoxN/HupN/NixA family nickel/cobalt transporter n=1 Tax=Campylobacter sp. TaxID=205 RepID=UPI003605F2B4